MTAKKENEDMEKQNDVRTKYNSAITKLLLGPGSEKINADIEHEIISEKPQSRYATGILYPLKKDVSVKDELKYEFDESIDKEEDSINVDNSFQPSSLGLTFYCEMLKNDLNIDIKSAYYNEIENPYLLASEDSLKQLKEFVEISKLEKIKGIFEIDLENRRVKLGRDLEKKEQTKLLQSFIDEIKKQKNQNNSIVEDTKFIIEKLKSINFGEKSCYVRNPISFNLTVDFANSNFFCKDLKNDEVKFLQVFAKRQELLLNDGKKIYAITIVVKNIGKKPLFQSVIEISSQTGIKFKASEDVKLPDLKNLQYEDAMNSFLYREKKTYAFGRGVSVNWEFENGSILSIRTAYMPSYELLPMSFDISGLKNDVLRADSYIDSGTLEISKLRDFVEKYDNWIIQTAKKIELLEEEYQPYAEKNINECKKCCERMKKTIDYLEVNKLALKAFSLANEAMILQRIKDLEFKKQCFNTKDYSAVEFKWRPFQLAFVLNSLESILNEESDERDVLDLVWVSTGGGKTEAYLFAIAAVIVYRRLNYSNSSGVSVIMRYTLRLLTSQQFDRASQLIVALEFLRKELRTLGDEEISIGLWIGEGTDNNLADAKESFNNMVKSDVSLERALKMNTFQVLKCPWCHEKHSIVPDEKDTSGNNWGYQAILKKNIYNMGCRNKKCNFYKKLPIFVVDQTIYKVRPTLLFGTVDKFAQVPLKENAQKLFGSDNLDNFRRPELIIQDELHLISGPLGSIVGLYEAGFDYIMKQSKNSTAPKYIASTATIRNAEEQVRGIFDRKVFQFPPNGISVSDNFFVRENAKGYGRKYVGVMATGKSQVTTEIRLISAMLQTILDLGLDLEEEELFWTITGYFNSIRELGKAAGLIRDDVKEYINQLKFRNNTKKRYMNDSSEEELTSKKKGTEIPDVLKKLERVHKHTYGTKVPYKEKPIDILLATNMLSVGVDIDRLNALFVVGQPKLTSEYIQATSRVGRKSLGVVYTLYNSTRSRDRSHYETFHSYHQNLYKFVEASSVTPYSIPSLNKAVAAVIVLIVRNTIKDLSGEKDAIKILEYEDKLKEIGRYLIDRLKRTEDNHKLYSDSGTTIIEDFINKWLLLAEEAIEDKEELLYYLYKTQSRNCTNKLLLKGFDDTSLHYESTKVMGSMRNVENNSYLTINEET